MLVLIKITFASIIVYYILVLVFSWKHGNKYKIEGNFGRRCNPIERLVSGFDKFIKL